MSELADRIAGQARLSSGTTAIVDSPRWPRDLDCSFPGVRPRDDDRSGRAIDAALRQVAKSTINQSVSMFPTPALAYFIGQIKRAGCKPHLRAFGRALFRAALRQNHEARGGTFTRFMLSGFATYRALALLGVESYEGYPDLQFRLWNHNRALPSKHRGRSIALAHRRGIVMQLARQLGCNGCETIRTLDEADAAILALSGAATSAHGTGVVIAHRAEGSLLVTFPNDAMVAFDA